MFRRLLVAITCVVMTAAFTPALAFANVTADKQWEAETIHYVSLGDAAAAGFGMGQTGYRTAVKGSYPALVRDALAAKGYRVDLDQLAMSGMRAEELRYLLDDSYAADGYLQENFPGLAANREDVRQSIAQADLITYGLGTVDFGAYLLYLVQDVDGRCSDPAVKAMVAGDPDGIVAGLSSVTTDGGRTIPDVLSLAGNSSLDYQVYIQAIAYAYYSFCDSFDAAMDLIAKANPQAEVIVLGVSNMLGDFSVSVNVAGVVKDGIKVGNLYNQQLISKANAHLQAAAGTHYVDTEGAQKFLDEIAGYTQGGTVSEQIKYYCDALEDDLYLKDTVTKQLTANKRNAAGIARGLTAAYDTAATCLADVAKISSVTITSINTATYLSENAQTLGTELMAGMRNKCLEYADAKAAKEYAVYTNALKSFASTGLYGSDAVAGKLIMAIGIRARMGDGFFQMPSAAGHAQLKDAIWSAMGDLTIHYPVQTDGCVSYVTTEFWQNVTSGKAYADADCTRETDRSKHLHAGSGHSFGKVTVTKAAGVGKEGTGTQVCTKCGTVKTVTIPGTNPAGTKLAKLTKAKKAITVKWQKPSAANLKNITGYQVRYSLKSSMAGAKTVTVAKNTATTQKIKKLKAKKKYYVQVRTYKTGTGGKKYYSAWSPKKSVKTK